MDAFPVTNGVTTFLPPPEGYEVDFDNPRSRHVIDHYLIFGFLGTLALLCLAQRLYTKHFIVGGLKIDDYLMIGAWIASLVMQSVQTWSISIGGLGHHAWEMPIEVHEKHMISSYIAAPVFIICNGLSKTSLLTFYFRISNQPGFRWAIWGTIGVVFCYTVVIASLLLFGCRTIHAQWDPVLMVSGTANCIDPRPLYIAIAIANIVSDVILFIIPIPTVMRLKMPLVQKLGAGLMFGVGSLTVATSIIRMVYLPGLLNTMDIPWVAGPANVWCFVEVDLFVICGSMPTFRKFFQAFAPKWLGFSYGSRSRTSKSNTHLSASRVSRIQRAAGYSQFDEEAEMDTLGDKNSGHITIEPRKSSDPVLVPRNHNQTVADCSSPRTAHPPSLDSSLDGRSSSDGRGVIVHTRTFDVQYSKSPKS